MGRLHPPLMIGKAAVLVGALAILLSAGGSIFGAVESSLQDLRDQYRRPAEIPFPDDNPYSDEKFNLGRTLFFDPVLSGSEIRSCASCHNPGLSWADGRQRAIGERPPPLRTP